MAENIDIYDMSDYPKDNPLHSVVNKNVLGKMKDECAWTPIVEYVGLRLKMYSIKKSDYGEIRKAKGVKKYGVKKHIKHEQYKEALFNGRTFKHEMNSLRSVNHRIYGLRMNKTSLSPLDTKRWID